MKGIIGLGNILRGDDGIGPLLAQKINEKRLPPNVKVYDLGTGGLKILHVLKDLKKVIIIDTVRFNGKPGDHIFFKPNEVKSLKNDKGQHNPDLFNLLEISKNLDEAPETILIFGIQPGRISNASVISPEVKSKIPIMIDKIQDKIKNL